MANRFHKKTERKKKNKYIFSLIFFIEQIYCIIGGLTADRPTGKLTKYYAFTVTHLCVCTFTNDITLHYDSQFID